MCAIHPSLRRLPFQLIVPMRLNVKSKARWLGRGCLLCKQHTNGYMQKRGCGWRSAAEQPRQHIWIRSELLRMDIDARCKESVKPTPPPRQKAIAATCARPTRPYPTPRRPYLPLIASDIVCVGGAWWLASTREVVIHSTNTISQSMWPTHTRTVISHLTS